MQHHDNPCGKNTPHKSTHCKRLGIAPLFAFFSLLAFLLLSLGAPAYAANVVNLDMFVGEVRSLTHKPVDRVAVGAGSVLRAKVIEGAELLVIAEAEGSSYLKLWYKDGKRATFNIRVSERDPEQRVLLKDMIRIKVQMIEFRKSAASELGINWDKAANGPTYALAGDAVSSTLFRPAGDLFPGAGVGNLPFEVEPFSTYFGISTGITSQINFMKVRGDAVTIAEPTLTCVNGGSAKFLSGGEIPFSSVNANGQANTLFKEYGIKLDIYPRAGKDGNIYTEIVSELSQPDLGLIDSNGVPALLTRRTESQMNVRDGQTIVISGLLDVESGKNKSSIPGLGDIPLLGAVFTNYDYQHDLRELVLFVTPEVIKPDAFGRSAREVKLYNDSRAEVRKVAKKLKYSIME